MNSFSKNASHYGLYQHLYTFLQVFFGAIVAICLGVLIYLVLPFNQHGATQTIYALITLTLVAISLYLDHKPHKQNFLKSLSIYSLVFLALFYAFYLYASLYQNTLLFLILTHLMLIGCAGGFYIGYCTPFIRYSALMITLIALPTSAYGFFLMHNIHNTTFWFTWINYEQTTAYIVIELYIVLYLTVLLALGLSDRALKTYALLIGLCLVIMGYQLISPLLSLSFQGVITKWAVIGFLPVIISHLGTIRLHHWMGIGIGISVAGLMLYFLPIGLLIGLALLFIAYYQQSTFFYLAGLITFSYALFAFYYDLELTLIMKSLALILSGCALIVLRLSLARLLPQKINAPLKEES